jgi:hypothetical protein
MICAKRFTQKNTPIQNFQNCRPSCMERHSVNELSARKFSALSLFAYRGAGKFLSFLLLRPLGGGDWGFRLKCNN